MLSFIQIALSILYMNTTLIFDFEKNASIREWQIVDDVVMGGRSDGTFQLDADGHGVFSGTVSLENNGGFSSVRYRTATAVSQNGRIKLFLKGDRKSYQFRVKHDARAYYSYITTFSTSGEWQEVEIPLSSMYPSFRGRRLSGSNFTHSTIEEITFLIGNKKPERFQLMLDKIELVED